MANFYLVDQSLKGLGGHHFDYTKLLSEAASEAQWKVIVGCHRKFQSDFRVPNSEVRNCFRFTTYASCSSLVGIQDMVARRKDTRFVRRILSWISGDAGSLQRKQNRRIQAFCEDCHSLFDRPLTRNDIVFFTTLSDLEAEGLYRFLRERPDAKLANWHLQFHFPLFRGRTPEYDCQQKNIDAIAKTLRKFKTVSGANVRFYVTSDNLKDQYERTGLEFEELPYPVNPELHTNRHERDSNVDDPVATRLTFAGAIRGEKGGSQIENLIDQLDQNLDPSIQLCVQKKKPKWLARILNLFARKEILSDRLEIHPYPLSADSYRAYISQSSIGLLTTYDSETYFSRRAGILGEYLSAGVPVIVPAGSWLSDQLEAVQRRYLRQVIADHDDRVDQIQPKFVANQSSGKTIAEFHLESIAENSNQLYILSFNVIKPSQHGNYFRISVQGENGSINDPLAQVVGKDRDRAEVMTAILLPKIDLEPADSEPGKVLERISVDIQPAYGSQEWQIEGIRLFRVRGNQPIPRSAVGLIAADPIQTAPLAQEMISQFEHYRQTAIEFSALWFSKHDPCLTFQTLVNHSILSEPKSGQAA